MLIPVKSSFIRGIGYNPFKRSLTVRFDLKTYQYRGVPLIVFLMVLFSRSRGAKFHDLVRGVYPHRVVS
jgi:hypothetical protein